MIKDEMIQAFARDNGYDYAVKAEKKWKGYDVYELCFNGDEDDVRFVGLPYAILIRNNDMRMSTPSESLALLDFLYPNDEK